MASNKIAATPLILQTANMLTHVSAYKPQCVPKNDFKSVISVLPSLNSLLSGPKSPNDKVSVPTRKKIACSNVQAKG